MRIVTVIGVPLTRISSGSSTARVSGRAMVSSAVTCLTRRRAVTRPIADHPVAGPTPAERSSRITTAFDTGVFDLAAA